MVLLAVTLIQTHVESVAKLTTGTQDEFKVLTATAKTTELLNRIVCRVPSVHRYRELLGLASGILFMNISIQIC